MMKFSIDGVHSEIHRASIPGEGAHVTVATRGGIRFHLGADTPAAATDEIVNRIVAEMESALVNILADVGISLLQADSEDDNGYSECGFNAGEI